MCTSLQRDRSTYVPNSDCGFDALQAEVAKYRDKSVILCGDFNARTGSENDFDPEITYGLPGANHWS